MTLWLVLLLSAPPAFTQDAPLVDQPSSHFYHAQGASVKVAWIVEPTTIPEDGELKATLLITGATNPDRIIRPDLKTIPEFQTRFIITDNPDPKPTPGVPEVRFSYQLRPRSRTVDAVPTFKFHYYNPSATPGKKQFPLTTARSVPITVTESPKREPVPIPLTEPEYLFAISTGPQVLEPAPFSPGMWIWPVVALAGPFLALGWYVGWRRVYPDAVRLAKLRRSRAARRVLEAVRKATRTVDPPAAIATSVLAYLKARFPLSATAATPHEIESALSAAGASATEASAAGDFFRACDAARFDAGHEPGRDPSPLAAEAERLVARMEAP